MKKQTLLSLVLLALLSLLAFWPMFRNGFVWDDRTLLVENPAIRGLWPPARFFPSQATGESFPMTGDRAVMVFSFALDHAFSGLNPFGYHLSNLLLHILCVFGVFWLARWLTRSRVAAFLAGALFALHPGHAEGVLIFDGRSDLLSTLFILLGLWGYVRSREPGGGRKALYYTVSLASFLLACYSKETGLVLLGLLVVYEVFGLRESPIPKPVLNSFQDLKSKILRLLPFLLLGLFYWFQRAKALGSQTAGSTWWGGSPYINYLMVLEVYARYLRLAFLPLFLSPMHEVPVPAGFWDGHVLWGLALVLGSLGVTAWALWKHFKAGFLVSWFLLGLVPLINLIPVPGAQILNEHRLYLASVGLCVLGGWGAWKVYQRGRGWLRTGWAVFLALVLVFCGVRTFLWCAPWKTDESVSRAIVATTPENALGHYNLGDALAAQGRVDEAVSAYREAVRLKPDYVQAHNNLGNALKDQGRLDEAIAELRQTILLSPFLPEPHNNLGTALGQQGKTVEAVAEIREAVRLNPDFLEAHLNLGILLARQGKAGEAISEYRQALRLDPGLADARFNLGVLLGQQGRITEAIAELRQAVLLSPGFADARFNLGNALLAQGNAVEAVAEYREALRLQPGHVAALENLAGALDALGRRSEAREAWFRAGALEQRPEWLARIKSRLAEKD